MFVYTKVYASSIITVWNIPKIYAPSISRFLLCICDTIRPYGKCISCELPVLCKRWKLDIKWMRMSWIFWKFALKSFIHLSIFKWHPVHKATWCSIIEIQYVWTDYVVCAFLSISFSIFSHNFYSISALIRRRYGVSIVIKLKPKYVGEFTVIQSVLHHSVIHVHVHIFIPTNIKRLNYSVSFSIITASPTKTQIRNTE